LLRGSGKLLGRPPVGGHLGRDEPRRDGINGDAMRPEFHGESPREHRHCRFRRRIKSGACHGRAVRRYRSQIHNPAEAPRLHARDDRARDRDQAIDVRVTHALHLAVIEIREITAPKDAGIVDQNLDRTKLALQFLDHCAHRACITHVRGQRQRSTSCCPNFRGQ